jgi:peroxiredoxin
MKEGDIAPNFILKNENGNEFELYKNLDSKVLLVFYPKDDTPVCSSQLSDYNDNLEEFIKNGIKVVGINADSVQSHNEFCNKLELQFPILSDKDKKVSRKFGALNLLGMNKRLLVLVDVSKTVSWISYSLPVNFIRSVEILDKIGSLNSKEMT